MSGLGGVADPAGHIHQRPEDVTVVTERFAGGDTDPNPEFGPAARGAPRLERPWMVIET
jgi:hypothetical protein